jgi:hypothetical protein
MKKLSLVSVKNLASLTKLYGLFAILLLSSMNVSGQGTVKGTINDVADNAPLIAATVFVEGTTKGTITDYNGEYVLVLKAGTYNIQISYIGYAPQTKSVTVVDNQIVELNANLAATAIMFDEVVVTMQARGQLAAVNQQLRSNQIINVVSAERIKELPDQNAAQAVSRLPGIHLDGSEIVIRGIQSKMNKILINGVEMPSTEANNRATSIGMISANMLSGIEVYKTLTPDMDADGIGGVVNLKLQEARKGLHYSIMTQGAYNQQEALLGNARFWGDISNRFFDNKLGVSVNLNYDKYKGGNDEVSVGYTRVNESQLGIADYMWSSTTVSDELKESTDFGGNVVLDYKLPKGQFIFTSMLTKTYSESIKHTNAMSTGLNISLNHNQSERLLLNNSLRYKQQIGIVKLDASASSISIDKQDDFNYEYGYSGLGQDFSKDSLTNKRRLTMEPWEIYSFEIPDSWKNSRMKEFKWTPGNFKENQIIADLNLEVPWRISDQVSANFKTGGKYRRMRRENNESQARYGDDILPGPIQAPMKEWLSSVGQDNYESVLSYSLFRDYDYATNPGFMNNSAYYSMPHVLNVDYARHMAVDLMDYNTLQVQPGQWSGDYWGGEELFASYLMAEVNLWSRLIVIGGARYESITNNYSAMEVASVSKNTYLIKDTITRPVTHVNLLPHLHVRWRVTDWWDIRFSYNQTLSRPDYKYAIPSIYYDQIGGTGSAGSPTIAPALSKNLDANFTFYSRKLGLVTIDGFMKTIEDIFYSQPTQIANIPDTIVRDRFPTKKFQSLAQGTTDYYINNPNPAYLKGLEAEWQSNLTYLPAPFNGLVLNVNYTHVWSETNYVQNRVFSVWIPKFPFFKLVENDTVFSNRLLHQANDIANVSLGYDYKGFSSRASFRFQGNVISGIGEREEDNKYTNNVYKFDFVMKQRIPLKFAKLEVFFNAVNFTNDPYRRYSVYPNKGKTNTLTRYSGRQFQLGIRFTN